MADGKVVVDTDLDTSGFEDGLSELGSLATSGLKATTTAIAAVGSGLIAMAGYAVTTGMEFESAMSRVQAISGATAQEFGKLEEQAISLGASTAYSATEAAQGMENLASAGFTVEEIYDAMPGMLNLAASSGEDLATSADIAASTLRGFGLEASQAAHVADVLAKNAADTNAAVYDTGEAMKYVAPVANAMGLSLEEVTASIGLMANAGIQGSQAGTTLRGALTRLTNPTDKMAATMDKLGLSFFDSEGKMKSLTEMTAMLKEKTAGLTDEERNAALATLFGQEALSGMLALIEAGPEELAALTESLENCDGAAEAMADTMLNNLKGSVESLTGAIETLGILVYKELQEPLKDLAEKGEGYIHQLTDAFQEGGFEGLVSEIGTVFADITSMAMAAAPEMVTASVSVIQSFITGLSNSMPEIASAAVEIGVQLISGITQIIPQALSCGLDFMTNLASGIAQSVPQLTENIGSCITDMLNTIGTSGGQFITAGIEMIVALASGIAQQAPSILEAGVNMLENLASGIIQSLPTLIPLALETILTLASGFIANIGSIVDIGISILTALVEGVVNAIPLLITEVPRIINDFWAAFDENAFKLLQAGLGLIVQLGAGIIQNIPLIIANAGEIVSAIFNTIMHLDLLSAGKALITNLGTGIKAMVQNAGQAAKSVADNIFNIIKNTNWLSLGQSIITFLKNGIINMVSAVGAAGGNVAKAAWNAIKNIDWLGLGKNIITFLINGVKGMASSLGTAALNVAKAGMNAFKNCDWASVGKNLISGIVSGITATAGKLVTAAVNAAKNAINTVKGWLGINSPSRRAKEEIGEWILPGIGEGIEETEPELNKSMQSAAEEMVDAFNNAKDIDVSGLVGKMKQTVNAEIGDITQDVTIRSNTGSSQVRATEGERFNYGKLGTALVDALVAAGIKVEVDERELGRLIAELA